MRFGQIFAAAFLAGALSTSAQQYSFTNTANSVIPDSNPNGLYTTIAVDGIFGTITNVTISLEISGGYNGDLYGYLTSDNGGFAVLLNRVGRTAGDPVGYGDAGFNVTLSDLASMDIHAYGGNSGNPLTGTWQPDGRNTDPQLTLDTDARTAFLSSFDDLSPNGTWTLFLADFANESESTLVSWTLTFAAIPEPGTAALLGLGAAAWFCARRRNRA